MAGGAKLVDFPTGRMSRRSTEIQLTCQFKNWPTSFLAMHSLAQKLVNTTNGTCLSKESRPVRYVEHKKCSKGALLKATPSTYLHKYVDHHGYANEKLGN